MLDHEKGIDVLSPKITRGFTLIELMIALVVLGVLLSLGVPAFSKIISNSRVRSVTEALQNGLRLAQNEAVRRSRQTAFVLTNATPSWNAAATIDGKNWYIQVIPGPGETSDNNFYVQGGSFGNQASGVSITSGVSILCFNSIGRAVSNSATGLGTCTAPTATSPITFNVTTAGADRTLALEVGAGGKIRMCDKSVPISSNRPDGC